MSFQPPRDRPVQRAFARIHQVMHTVEEGLEMKFWPVTIDKYGHWKAKPDVYNFLNLDPHDPNVTIDGTPEHTGAVKIWEWESDGKILYHLVVL